MKQMISLPRQVACTNCTGRTLLEYDQIDVGVGDITVHLSAVPYYQCQECDHRQMDAASQEHLDEGLDQYLSAKGGSAKEYWAMLHWREVLSLDLDGGGNSRLFQVEWSDV